MLYHCTDTVGAPSAGSIVLSGITTLSHLICVRGLHFPPDWYAKSARVFVYCTPASLSPRLLFQSFRSVVLPPALRALNEFIPPVRP